MEDRKVTLKHLIFYGVGDIFGGGSFIIINMFFLYFLISVVGISPGWAGFVFGIGKVWDAVSDPLMGYISDQTRSRFGRRRLYFLLAIIPIAVSFTLMWLPVKFGSQSFNVAYYSFAYILFSTVFTMVMVPYSAINAEMSHDYDVRTRLSGARIIFSLFSALLAGTIPSIIIKSSATPDTGHLVMAAIFGIFYALPWFIVFFGTWELPHGEEKDEVAGIKEVFKNFATLVKNRSFLVHIAMYICAYTAMDGLMMLFKFYLKWNIGKPNLFALAMGSLMGAQILMLGLYVFISNKKGKGFAFRMGLAIWASGMVLSYFITNQSPAFMLVGVCVLMGAGLSAGVMVPWAILPSVIDVDELMTTKKRAGTYSGAMTLVRKMVQGLIAAPLIGVSLSLIGYVEKAAEQSPETISNLKILFFAAPLTFIVLGFLISFLFKITPQTHKVLREELERLREGGSKADVSEEAKAVTEKLTGVEYSKLYHDTGAQ